MEERKRAGRNGTGETKNDGFAAVTVVQIVLCVLLLVFFGVFSAGKSDFSQRLSADFSALMKWESMHGSAGDVMKFVEDYLSKPVRLFPAFSPVTENEQTEPSLTESTEPPTQADPPDTEKEPAAEEIPAAEKESEKGVFLELGAKPALPSFASEKIVPPVKSKRYTSFFGDRVNPITGEEGFHTGLDIAAPEGAKVRAAFSGRVLKTGEDSRSGKYIFLTHSDGYETFYCHCSEILAPEGALIRSGETIALAGSTGWSTGPHLHFEIHQSGKRLDPLPFLQK